MRLGLMSTANINDALLGATPDGVEIAAVASRDGAKAQAYAAEHGIARVARQLRGAPRQTTSSTPSTSRCRTGCTTSGR